MASLYIVAILLSGLSSTHAFWRLLCDGSTGLARMDPLMNPGTIGDHVHSIKGGSAFSTTSTSSDLLKSKCASCSVGQDMSAYWTPALYFVGDDGTTEVVPEKPPHKSYYFLNGGMTHDGQTQKIEAFPEGFQMLAGNNYNRNSSIPSPDPNPLGPWPEESQDLRTQRAIGFNCLNYAKGTDEPSLMRHVMPDKGYLDANCADGVRLELMFPSCWNGEKDGEMHKSHVAYPDGVMTGNCPEGYDRRLVSLFYETIVATDAYKGKNGQFVFSNGDPHGYGYHGDFIEAWQPGVLQQAVDTCTSLSGEQEACPVFNFPPNTGSCTLENPLPEAIAHENVKGPRQGLPGGLAIQSGPEMATKPGAQPAATPPPSTANYRPSIAKNPVLPLHSQASKAEASHTVGPEAGGQFVQKSAPAKAAPSTPISPPTTTPAPAGSVEKPKDESTIDIKYTTIGREVHEQIDVMVDVTVTAHPAVQATPAHKKRHHHQHHAHGHGIGGRRFT